MLIQKDLGVFNAILSKLDGYKIPLRRKDKYIEAIGSNVFKAKRSYFFCNPVHRLSE